MSAGRIKFDDFELDCDRYELVRAGRSIKLEKIPMELLLLLVAKNGNLVTRQEIIERLWGADVFVDTEHGINTAIRKIRQALRDDPEQPRYVQTVTGKGYRFVAEIEGACDPLPNVKAPVTAPAPAATRTYSGRRIVAVIVAVGLVCLAILLQMRRSVRAADPPPKRVMLAVLPFQNLSADPAQEFFSDGLTEELIAQLGHLNPDAMGVIARTTSMAYKKTNKSVAEIGAELGVDYVLESSVRREGGRVRISAQLIRAQDQTHIWAESYDAEVGNSIALQEELAQTVARQIQIKLLRPSAREQRPSDPEANEEYLRGQYFWNKLTEDGLRKAATHFEKAIDKDPYFAPAYSGLSHAYLFLAITDAEPPRNALQKARAAADRAVALDDSFSDGHAALGTTYFITLQWSRADAEMRRGVALNPSSANAHRMYAAYLAIMRRDADAWREISQARQLDPLSGAVNAEIVRTLYYARRYEDAVAAATRAEEIDPDFPRTHFWLGRVLTQMGRHQEAIAEAKELARLLQNNTLSLTELAFASAAGGHRAEAQKTLAELDRRSRQGFVPEYDLAVVHLALGENDTAIEHLQKARTEGDWALMALRAEPRLDALRADPRFIELLKETGPAQ